jgi:glycosyltransferase involved in cell wall biosynthesis
MNYSLAFTTYNSYSYIVKQLEQNYFEMSDHRIDEIVIQDDCSSDYELLQQHTNAKIKVFQNPKNLSPLLSRVNLVTNCKNERVLLMDSDNFLDVGSFRKINNIVPQEHVIYCPDYARPNFQFKEFSDKEIDLAFAKQHLNEIGMQIFLNTGNYFVPRSKYLEVAQQIDPKFAYYTVDVIYFNCLWLKSGNKLQCVKDYEYNHTMRGDSYYATHGCHASEKLKEVNSLF